MKSLKLQLNINEPKAAGEAHEVFLGFAIDLFKKAMESVLPEDVCSAIQSGSDTKQDINSKKLSVSMNDWGADGKYSLTFLLETAQEPEAC